MKDFREARVDKTKLINKMVADGAVPESTPSTPALDKIEALFVEGLGRSRVKREDIGITLSFDIATPKEMDQSNRLKYLAHKHHVACFVVATNERNIQVFIPAEENLSHLRMIAEQLAVRIVEKPDGEIQRPIIAADPEHVFERITKAPWKEVKGSPYGVDILEPILNPADDATRSRREYAMAYVLEPQGGADFQMRNWLKEQRFVEKLHNMEPRTAVPKSWANEDGISRAEDIKYTSPKAQLPKVFGRG